MPVSGKLIRELLLLFLQFGVLQSYAQRITRQYNNVSFSAALKDLNARQHKYTINFVYDELEDFRVTKSIRNQSVPDAIMQLIGFYPIRMTQVDRRADWCRPLEDLLTKQGAFRAAWMPCERMEIGRAHV